MKRFLILGAGVAGKRAAAKIRQLEPQADIVIVEEQNDPFYYKPMLGEFLAGTIGEERTVSRDKELFSGIGAKLMTGVRAVSLDTGAQEVTLDSGERVGFDKLLIASGTRAAMPAGWSEDIPGVYCLDRRDNARQILSKAGSAGRALVVGASLQALSAMRGLRGQGLECTLLVSGDRYWDGVLDPIASEILETRLAQEGVSLVKQSSVESFVVKDGRLTGVVTSRGEELPADLVVMAGPQVPAADCLSGTGLAEERGVPVDGRMRTKQENIFAAGDVALPPAGVLDAPVPHAGWLNAWDQGEVAGVNMAGGEAVYTGIPALRTRAFHVDMVCMGLSDATGAGEVREDSGDYPYEEFPYIYKKIVYRDRKVAGALFMGEVSEAGRIGEWIQEGRPEDQVDRAVLDQMFQTRITAIKSIGALCPVCKYQMQLNESCEDGDVVTCPACGVNFRVERMANGAFRAGKVVAS